MIANKKTIIFTIEIADRELLGKCLLALEMARKGFRVYIGTFRSVHEIRNMIKSCIFFHKSAYKRRALQYKRKMGAVVAIMDEEAGIAIPPHRMDDFCRFRFGSLTPEAYDYVFTIGENYTKKLSELTNLEGIKVITTGWPRIDLWREDFRHIHEKKIEDIRKMHGSYWLFVSSFGFTSQAGYERRLARAYSEQATESVRNVKQALDNYIDLIHNLAADRNQKIIIRPHTSEDMKEWKDLFSEQPNVLIIREGDITPWLLAADGVITYRSTVNIQAALNGIPTVQYKINEIDGINELAVFKVSKCAETINEVKEYLNSFSSTNNRDRLRDYAIEALGNNVDSLHGKTASEKIADILAQASVTAQPEIRIPSFKRMMSNAWKKYKFLEFKASKALFKHKKSRRMSRFEKIPNGIQANEIFSILESLNSTKQEIKQKIKVTQVSTDLVSIEI